MHDPVANKWMRDVHRLSTEDLLIVHIFLKKRVGAESQGLTPQALVDLRTRLAYVRRELELRGEQLELWARREEEDASTAS